MECVILLIEMWKLTTNAWKIMIKINNQDIKYCDVNNLHGWAMQQKLPVDSVKWVENASQFNKKTS